MVNFELSARKVAKVYYLSYMKAFWPLVLLTNPLFLVTILKNSGMKWRLLGLVSMVFDYLYCYMLDYYSFTLK